MEGAVGSLTSLDMVLLALCTVVAGLILQNLLGQKAPAKPAAVASPSRKQPSSSSTSSSAPGGGSGGDDSEVLRPTSDAAAPPSASAARDPAPKGAGMPDQPVAGVATPFAATQVGEPDSNGHVAFRYTGMPAAEAAKRAAEFQALMQLRRSVRFFAPTPLPEGVLERCVATAASAPSGAHLQPWTFVIVRDRAVRAEIRAAVEAEERLNYAKRMKKGWVDDVAPLVSGLHAGGDVTKPYIEDAPGLVVVMEQPYGREADGSRRTHYYPRESVGLAAGFLIAALTNAGLFTLTSTPMGAEATIRTSLGRPSNERVFLLMPIGYPAAEATVPFRAPGAERKPTGEAAIIV
ncbi:hypothetical protein FNF27_06047 [Cafeteria roenbergensis]|uniref:Nitroreductase domain-containing protein n=2 Tax=Cafeteria roenbergensis TaxID=33653 RepID=A0A5A8E5Z4_CAFRO|nr:hypothetical protein FNF27_06047 [Cafeteria roenbergensis]